MTVGDTLTCRIDTLAYGGDGIARIGGLVVFAPKTIAGETVRIRVTQLKKNFARARLCDVLEPAPTRIAPCCRVNDPDTGTPCQVPGCVYDHLDYAAELLAKQQQIEAFVARLPHDETTTFLSPVGSPASLHYRNKIVLHAVRDRNGTRLGYRLEPSHRVLDIASCPLACDALNHALAELRSSRHFASLPCEADVTFRHTPHDGAVWWLDRAQPTMPCAELLTEASPAGPLRVPRDGFFQVNPSVGDALTRTVSAWFAESPDLSELLDLYCGVGVFGLACMAAGGTRLTGVEAGRAAVAAARLNASTLGHPATFLCHALGQEDIPFNGLIGTPHRTTAIVDPPRDGMAPDSTRALADSGIARIFYVSCDPATLSRDLAILLASGRYRLGRMRLFDMFPRTAHFETLVELTSR
jgi:23S rRNA (uracil1939-C5)-methyltransferase